MAEQQLTERASPLRALCERAGGWGFALATKLIVDAFLLLECTVDARIYGWTGCVRSSGRDEARCWSSGTGKA
jgi:hypothetical protein